MKLSKLHLVIYFLRLLVILNDITTLFSSVFFHHFVARHFKRMGVYQLLYGLMPVYVIYPQRGGSRIPVEVWIIVEMKFYFHDFRHHLASAVKFNYLRNHTGQYLHAGFSVSEFYQRYHMPGGLLAHKLLPLFRSGFVGDGDMASESRVYPIHD